MRSVNHTRERACVAGQDFRRRFVNPVLTVFAAAGISFLGYFGSRHLSGSPFLHQTMAGIFGATYFISIAFGALYVYATAYVRGASLPERVLASFITPFGWMTKEVFILTASHPFLECLYWYFNPLNLWLTFLILFEMGTATLIARAILIRRGEEVRIVTATPVGAILISLFFIIFLIAWGKGENVYVMFLEGYRFFFGSGT